MLTRCLEFLRYAFLAITFLVCPVKLLLVFVNHDLFSELDETRLQAQCIVLLFSLGLILELLSLARKRRTTAARERENLGKAVWQQIFAQHPYLAYGKNFVAAHSCVWILISTLLTCCYLKEEIAYTAAYLANSAGQYELSERFFVECKKLYKDSSFAKHRGFLTTTATIDADPTAQVLVKVYGRKSNPVADWQQQFGLNPEASLSARVGALGEAAKTYLELGLINDALAALASQATICLKDDEVMAARLVREAAALFPQGSYPMNSLRYFSLQYCARQIGDEEALKVFTAAESPYSYRKEAKQKGFFDATSMAILLSLLPFTVFGLGTATVKELILWRQGSNLEKRYKNLSQTLSDHGKPATGLPANMGTESNAPQQEQRWQLIATLNSQIDLALYRGHTWLAESKSLQLLQVASEGTTSGIDGIGMQSRGTLPNERGRRWMIGTLSGIVSAESGCLLLLTLFVILYAF